MKSLCTARVLLVVLCLCLVGAPSSFGWGNKGHKMINKLAAESLPADVPAFLRTPEAINEIEYLGPEPDRWRSRAEPELSAEQAPDHFIDMEFAERIGTLPRRRYDYIAALYAYAAAHPDQAQEMRPERVGFQPYVTEEVWQRLKSAMRDYRTLSAQPGADTKPVEAAILFYAGWLGHYVGDGSQPLHVTIQYNGWVGPNPNGYTTDHQIHWKFESEFIDAVVNESDAQPLMTPLKPIGEEWDVYLAYLHQTGSLVEKTYQLDKVHAFDGTGTPEGKQFAAERLAAGASMLRDLIVAAWMKSAEPVPEWHDENAAPKTTGTGNSAGTPAPNAAAAASPSASAPLILSQHPEITPPKRIDNVAPRPVPVAGGTAETVVLGLTVNISGVPENIHLVRGANKEEVMNAMDAVRQYRFKPAMYQGKPVPVVIYIQMNFH
jgi:Gram-negative bacterial TonB protein C-terminal/S1/P1 Nuclease